MDSKNFWQSLIVLIFFILLLKTTQTLYQAVMAAIRLLFACFCLPHRDSAHAYKTLGLTPHWLCLHVTYLGSCSAQTHLGFWETERPTVHVRDCATQVRNSRPLA